MRNLFWCFLFSTFFTSGVIAQPELDTTFAGTGWIDQIGAIAYAEDLVVQPDNKIVMISNCNTANGDFQFCALRYNEDGTLDATFGGPTISGFAFINIPGIGNPKGVTGAALQGDKLVLTGFGRVSPDERLVMIRLNSNGSLDSSFGSGGVVQTDITPAKDDRPQDVVIQPDGKIVVVGYTHLTTNKPETYRQFFARYLADGTLDSSFGDGGIVRTDISEYSTFGKSIVLQTDGRIIAGGYRTTLSGASPAHILTRLNPNGSPDLTWGGNGVSTIPGSSDPYDGGFSSLAIQSDGRIVAIGNTNSLYRFNPDGSLDMDFDGDGSRFALSGDSLAHDLTISAGGRITVVGQPIQTSQLSPRVYRLARFLSDGSPDAGFSEDGFLDIQPGGWGHIATSVAVDNRGRIVVGGASISTLPVFSVVRLLAPIVSVNIAGRVTRSNGNPASNITVSLGQNGTTIATARTNPFGYYSFANVMTGQGYTVVIKARGSLFPRHDFFLADDISSLDFVEGQTSTKAVEEMKIESGIIEFRDDRKSPR